MATKNFFVDNEVEWWIDTSAISHLFGEQNSLKIMN